MKEPTSAFRPRYLSLASSLLALPGLQAQVRYVDIPDTTLDQNRSFIDLNIDQDTAGLVDYRIIQYVDSTEFDISGAFIQSRGLGGNSILGLDYGNYNYPFKLLPGDPIGPQQVFRGSGGSASWGQLVLEANAQGFPNDQFGGSVDAFIGLRFRTLEQDTIRTFYGWLRVDVAADARSITLRDYAYQETADQAIFAGEGWPSLALEALEPAALQMRQVGPELWLESQASGASLEIHALSGQLLQRAEIARGQSRFSLADLPAGVHSASMILEGKRESIKIFVQP